MTAIDQSQRAERRLGLELSFGTVVVSEQVVAYQKKSIHDQASLDIVQLDLPQTEFETEAIWFVPEPWMTEDLDSSGGCSARSTPPSTR
jgi:DEAD/DEAH box helicase domain-containing protein